MRTILFALALVAPSLALAQGEPPIQGPQDAACRDEARDRVFGAPNPKGLSLYNLGVELYQECMRRAQAPANGSRSRRRQSS
ncbi:hypothetical protein OPKNFCMD_1028 [Methylobacterium crusticola]|uniref:3',5'-cyclic-nucleotide phosphodiesterase n=1 Tax=Methylobacterium crusticola TaxID=1697972 RepID=A0ABQ4QTB9_9HYPH|nr:hypothetical protein [Methylobacterium crusticola]GJD48311.1 hypothetical protein OPKNFCMD_1028 [Methylobacterium crusticola]